MKTLILSIISFTFNLSFSQHQEKRNDLVNLFCIDYSDVSFGEYGEIIDYNLEEKTELTEENVKKMFLGNKDVVERRNYWTDEVVDTLTAEDYLKNKTFYLRDTVLSKKKWTAIIIEEIDNDFWDKSSDKYVVTINRKQELISKYRIAYYGRFGTYTCCNEDEDGNPIAFEDEDGNIVQDCGRCPWYTGSSGCIDKDLTIRLEGSLDNDAYIDKRGNIIKVK